MKLLFAGLAGSAAMLAASISLSPPTVTNCTNGLGRVTVSWSGATGPVDVRVGSAQGISMTGLTGPSGVAMSGDWVTDGMTFYLVNGQGVVEGQVSARVRCEGDRPDTESYFPLQIGNQWVYRRNSRRVTSDYVTQTVTGIEQVDGLAYYTISSDTGAVPVRLRSGGAGRILDSMGTVVLDPVAARRASFSGPLGVFPESIAVTRTEPLGVEDRIYARGIGLIKSESRVMAGSSGGFAESLELVEVRLAGGIRLSLPASELSLSIESTVLDVTGRKVTNCAVPSYCVACGLAGADPPNTYKPCAQARVEGRAGVELELRDAAGQTVFRAPASPDSFRYVQLPLYTSPNEPLKPGVYTLVATVKGEAEASLVVRID